MLYSIKTNKAVYTYVAANKEEAAEKFEKTIKTKGEKILTILKAKKEWWK